MVISQPEGLHIVDWVLIVLYAMVTIGLGVYFSRRQTSAKEYFVGSGHMNPVLIGVSLFATLLSTISYLSMPGEAAGKGPVVALGMLALPLVYFVVAYGLLPVYMKHRVTSAYELLETRLGLSVRLLGAAMFLALRLVWMTLLIYLAANAMVVMMGISASWIPIIVMGTGIVSIVYTTLGGLRAVVVTDAMQTVLLFGGAILVIVTVTFACHGLSWLPVRLETGGEHGLLHMKFLWQSNWDTQPFFSLDPKTRVTVLGTWASVFVWYTATLGGDQTSVQRFMATRDVRAARRALATQLMTGVTVQVTLCLVGFALLGYFMQHPEYLPADMNVKDDADDLFPEFIANRLPIGVSGLVVAAMFAAAMSSVDSGVNSITAVVMTDFLERFGWHPASERSRMRMAQALALAIGLVVVMGSGLMKYIEGNITVVTGKTVNLLTGPIFALFFFALFVPRAKPVAVWVGAICGVIAGASIAFSGHLVYLMHSLWDVDPGWFNVRLITNVDEVTGQSWTTAEDVISFQWIGPVALSVNLVVGLLISYALPARLNTQSDRV